MPRKRIIDLIFELHNRRLEPFRKFNRTEQKSFDRLYGLLLEEDQEYIDNWLLETPQIRLKKYRS